MPSNSIAYYNSGSLGVHGAMDRDAPNSHHIAWNFPGSNDAYTTEGWLPSYKVVNHKDLVAVTDISDSQWHTFSVEFNQTNQTLHILSLILGSSCYCTGGRYF
ncbi:MAG: hypothetical protein ACLSIL_17990 [Enterococcus casseliflavus]